MIAGIDLGGTQVRLAAARSDGRIVGTRKARTSSLGGPAGLVEWTCDALEGLRNGERLRVVGISAPGPLESLSLAANRACRSSPARDVPSLEAGPSTPRPTGVPVRSSWRTGAMPDPASLEMRRAFVAWDLVELDGQRLHDIPYQERRRLLESVIMESIRVRISPAVRPPIRGWLAAWQADGFTHFVAKQPNSRYWPGKTAPDWLQVSVVSDKMPSLLERVFGSRPARMRQAPRQPE